MLFEKEGGKDMSSLAKIWHMLAFTGKKTTLVVAKQVTQTDGTKLCVARELCHWFGLLVQKGRTAILNV